MTPRTNIQNIIIESEKIKKKKEEGGKSKESEELIYWRYWHIRKIKIIGNVKKMKKTANANKY